MNPVDDVVVEEAALNASTTVESMQRLGHTALAQLAWTVGKVVVALFISGSVSLGVSYIHDMRDDIKNALQASQKQDKEQALTDQKVDGLQKVSDATVLTLQSLTSQVSRTSFDVEELKQNAADAAARSRPRQ